MPDCPNPECLNPRNPNGTNFCQNCGTRLIPLRGRYRIIKPLGRGGFGITYLAEDLDRRNAPCVVKQFSPSQLVRSSPTAFTKAKALFDQEADQLLRLEDHPQIPKLLAFFEEERSLYLVQQFVQGQDLLKELHQQGALSQVKIEALLRDVLPVLEFIHEFKVIHRDIKPENIMRRQRDGRLILIDFGIARQVLGTLMTGEGTIAGTPGYAPPEQARFGKAFPASDLYSLGATCVHLLTNQYPTELYDSYEGRWLWRDVLTQKGQEIREPLGQVLDTLLQDLAKDRYQSAASVLNALNQEDLSSERFGASYYARLRDLLQAGNWQDADQETTARMCDVMNRQREGWLDLKQIQQFPCQDLQAIDRLWVKYSEGRFGFSVARKMWQDCGSPTRYSNEWEQFGDRVGWRINGTWISYTQIRFDALAPTGHLPTPMFGWIYETNDWTFGKGEKGAKGFSTLASRWVDCQARSR